MASSHSQQQRQRQRASGRWGSPHRTVVWTEPKNKGRKKVAVVYYLCREDGQLEHPHFMEVLVPADADHLCLRDFTERLDMVRGEGMASMYSWSSKRSYRNGFVWHDLTEHDTIHPAQADEYVLKGSHRHGRRRSKKNWSSFDLSLGHASSSLRDATAELGATDEEISPRPPSSSNSPDEEISPPSSNSLETLVTTGGRMRASSSVLTQLVSCVKRHSQSRQQKTSGGDRRDCFSGSLLEINNNNKKTTAAVSVLKRSSSYNTDRRRRDQSEVA